MERLAKSALKRFDFTLKKRMKHPAELPKDLSFAAKDIKEAWEEMGDKIADAWTFTRHGVKGTYIDGKKGLKIAKKHYVHVTRKVRKAL